jgi:hypothetical protein
MMVLFNHCSCGHIEEDHAMDAPEGEQECMAEDCDCEDYSEVLE